MADFSFLSDSDDEKAAKLILEQASDSIVLEQIAALNCSAFTDLPSHLESRFSKLKSFPSVSSKPNPVTRNHSTIPSDFKYTSRNDDDDDPSSKLRKTPIEKTGDSLKNEKSGKIEKFSSYDGDDDDDSVKLGKIPVEKTGDGLKKKKSGKTPIGEKGLKDDLEHGFDFDLSVEDDYFWDSIKKRDEKLKSCIERTISLPSGYSSESLSPPKKSGCFWCSPKRVSRNKSKNRSFDVVSGSSKKEGDVLSDLNSYLDKKQKRLMKKAMEEEMKICREAEKLVKLAKQASARIEISDIDDELTDTETENLK